MRALVILVTMLAVACSADSGTSGLGNEDAGDDAGDSVGSGGEAGTAGSGGGPPDGGASGSSGAGAGGTVATGGAGGSANTGGAGGSGSVSGAGGVGGGVPGTPIPNCVPWQACGCVWPPATAVCNTATCPTPKNGYKKCCYTATGPCGADLGAGCVPCAH